MEEIGRNSWGRVPSMRTTRGRIKINADKANVVFGLVPADPRKRERKPA
jgi:hypothetical protein